MSDRIAQVLEGQQIRSRGFHLNYTCLLRGIFVGVLGISVPIGFAGDYAKLPESSSWIPAGPYGGSADAIAASPTGTLLAASRHGRLFRSTDLGSYWQSISFPAESNAKIRTILFNGQDDRQFFIGVTHDHVNGVGLYQTMDGGRNWRDVPEFRGKQVWALAAWQKDASRIVAGTGDGVYLTLNSGGSWTRISPEGRTDLQPAVSVAFDPANAETIYAGTPHLPWRTTDRGASWKSVHTGMIDDSDVFSISPAAYKPGLIFASACTGIYRSEDGGENWSKMIGSAEASYRTYTIVPDPSIPGMVWAGTTAGLQLSIDGGVAWETVLPNAIRGIAIHKSGLVFVATDQGLIRADLENKKGAGVFESVNTGFEGYQDNALFAAADSLFVYGNEGSQVRFSKQGGWRSMKPADAAIFASSPRRGEIVAAAGRRLWISTDGGGACACHCT